VREKKFSSRKETKHAKAEFLLQVTSPGGGILIIAVRELSSL
jgi:hypothetical protein